MKSFKNTLLISLFFTFIISQAQIPTSVRVKNAIKEKKEYLTKLAEQKDLKLGNDVFIRIIKDEYLLEVWLKKDEKFKLLKSYKICSYSGGLGNKKKQGDGKSPEGFYFVKPYQLNAWSNYYLAFNIGYPNKYDKIHNYTGNYLMVHGNCCSIGCYAMTDDYIKEIYTVIYEAFKAGQPFFRIHIFPYRMTETNLKKYNTADYKEYYNFWENLKEGYNIFENSKIPPDVNVVNGKYSFNK